MQALVLQFTIGGRQMLTMQKYPNLKCVARSRIILLGDLVAVTRGGYPLRTDLL